MLPSTASHAVFAKGTPRKTSRVYPCRRGKSSLFPQNRLGRFPKARGGGVSSPSTLTWPPGSLRLYVRKVTTNVIIAQLMSIFCRNGFPTTLVSDNGPQFKSAQFSKYLKSQGIQYVMASPYNPQENGVVERMHGTLNAIIAKSCSFPPNSNYSLISPSLPLFPHFPSKGNWAEVVPSAFTLCGARPTAQWHSLWH